MNDSLSFRQRGGERRTRRSPPRTAPDRGHVLVELYGRRAEGNAEATIWSSRGRTRHRRPALSSKPGAWAGSRLGGGTSTRPGRGDRPQRDDLDHRLGEVVTYVGNWAAGDGTNSAITEAGIFNAASTGTMLARAVFSASTRGHALATPAVTIGTWIRDDRLDGLSRRRQLRPGRRCLEGHLVAAGDDRLRHDEPPDHVHRSRLGQGARRIRLHGNVRGRPPIPRSCSASSKARPSFSRLADGRPQDDTALATARVDQEITGVVAVSGGSHTFDAAYGVEVAIGLHEHQVRRPEQHDRRTTPGERFSSRSGKPEMACLGAVNYDPSTAVTKSARDSATVMTAFDTTNLRITFTAPASGLVQVTDQVRSASPGGDALPAILLGVLEGSTVVFRASPIGRNRRRLRGHGHVAPGGARRRRRLGAAATPSTPPMRSRVSAARRRSSTAARTTRPRRTPGGLCSSRSGRRKCLS